MSARKPDEALRKIYRSSGFTDKYGGPFWVNERGKYGVRYQCKACGKITLGTSGWKDPGMHYTACPYLSANPLDLPENDLPENKEVVATREPIRSPHTQEVMLRVSWSCLRHEDGQPPHARRGEVMLDLGLEAAPSPELTADEMQSVAIAAKFALLKALTKRKHK